VEVDRALPCTVRFRRDDDLGAPFFAAPEAS